MNLRDLMNKLDTLAEADAPAAAPVADPARAQYDKYKADDAQAAAAAQVKKMASVPLNQIGRLQNVIEPKTGVIYYGQAGMDSFKGTATPYAFDWYKKGQEPEFFNIIKTAGLDVVDNGKGYASVDPAKLATIDKPVVAPTPGPNGPKGNDDAAKLEALVAQLEKTLTGQGPMPSPDVVKPHPTEKKTSTTSTTSNVLATGAGALAGQQLAKKAGFGGVGQAVAGATGGAAGYLANKAFNKESAEARLTKQGDEWLLELADGTALVVPMEERVEILQVMNESEPTIANSLIESMEYHIQEDLRYFAAPNGMIVEYSWDQFKGDAGDFGRGAWNGVTLGTGDNIAAGVKSALGPGTYKDELKKQMATSQAAEKRSPWLYGAGNVAGSIAAPIPGGAVAGMVGKMGGGMLARGAAALGTNLAAQKGVDYLKGKADIATLAQGGDQKLAKLQQAVGTIPDGKFGPATQKALAAWQTSQGIPATGKPDQATYAKAGIAESTVAEGIKSLAERLAKIESGEDDTNDYYFYLDESTGEVFAENGELVLDETILSEINWGALGGKAWNAAKGIGSGIANVGKNFAGGLGGKGAQQMRTAGKFAGYAPGAKLANKAGGVIAKNPGKAALGAAALGAGGMAALAGGSAAAPSGTTTGGGSHSGGGTGGAGDTTAAGGLTPEQQALIKQIKDLTMAHGEDESPEWLKATGHMQVVLDKAEHASPEQAAVDAKNDAPAATNATADTTKGPDMGKVNPASGSAAAPAGTTTPTQTLTVPKVPAGTTVNNTGVTTPDPTLKVYKEGEEDELARWLRIARG